jgi:hypothetical protein
MTLFLCLFIAGHLLARGLPAPRPVSVPVRIFHP